jgi:hypothetical protein
LGAGEYFVIYLGAERVAERKRAARGSPFDGVSVVICGLFVALCGGKTLVDLFPIDGVPPGGEVVGALVLVFEVVGVLPDVVA